MDTISIESTEVSTSKYYPVQQNENTRKGQFFFLWLELDAITLETRL